MKWKRKSQDKKNGFVVIFMSVFLVVVLTLIFCFGSSLLLLRNKMESTQVCRAHALRIQNEAKSDLEKLLALNPVASSLRVQRKLVEAAIVAAFAAGQLELVAVLKTKKSKIILEQKALDKVQKNILLTANTKMKIGTVRLHRTLTDLLKLYKSKQRNWVDYSFVAVPPKTPALAVKPSDHNLAPVYLPKKDFENKQSISLVWVQKYSWKGLMRISQQINSHQKSQCRVTLEETTWRTKIQKDRPL